MKTEFDNTENEALNKTDVIKRFNMYPKIKVKKEHLLMVVMFTEKNKGIVVDNFKGNAKGEFYDFIEDDFIEIEKILFNDIVSNAIRENVL